MFSRRKIMKQAGVLGAGAMLTRASAAFANDESVLRSVDPELRDVAAVLLKAPKIEPVTANLPALRKVMESGRAPFNPAIPAERRMVPGRTGNPDVPVYLINSKPGSLRPAILHTHGGGFISGQAEYMVRVLQDWIAAPLDCVVVSSEYRLAPETTWRGSVEDNYAALKWLYDNAEALGVDRSRIAVMGESAGGGHAALLAIKARDRGEVPLIFQCLTYPMLDDRTGSTRPVAPQLGTLIHTPKANRFGWQSFLGMAPGGPNVPVAAVPARTENLKGLPPAFIGVGGIDLFLDEDIEYARRLTDAGVATQLIVVPGAFHGFDVFGPQTRLGKWFNDARFNALKHALAAKGGT